MCRKKFSVASLRDALKMDGVKFTNYIGAFLFLVLACGNIWLRNIAARHTKRSHSKFMFTQALSCFSVLNAIPRLWVR